MNSLVVTLLPWVGTSLGIVGTGGLMFGWLKSEQKRQLEADVVNLRKRANGLQATMQYASHQGHSLAAEVEEHRFETNRAANLQAQGLGAHGPAPRR